jgi:hypothetical protein
MSRAMKSGYKGKTLRQGGRQLKENVLGPFVYVFGILAVEVS